MSEEGGGPLPQLMKLLDKADIKAVRSFLPGKALGRLAALLALVLVVLEAFGVVDSTLRNQFHVTLRPAWLYNTLLLGLPLLVVAVQLVVEGRAERNRRKTQQLAVRIDQVPPGYFRIGPYLDTAEDRSKFSRADQAHAKVLEWIQRSHGVSLYLTGDSGTGKSSLLNAFVVPSLRQNGWTVVRARAGQDPEAALVAVLPKLPGALPPQGETPDLYRRIQAFAAGPRLLLVLDQFEEFMILGDQRKQTAFAAVVAKLCQLPIEGIVLLLVLRSDYQIALDDLGLPPLRQGENWFQVGRFTLAAATRFMRGSGLDLRADTLDRILTSATHMDDTPGLLRPITLNVIGHVLAEGQSAVPSLDAGRLVDQYVRQAVEQPAIRGFALPVLEKMVTEQGTKQPRRESDLASETHLRLAEVRAVLNALSDAGLARPLDPALGVWELSHDFVAHAVVRYLGRRRGASLRRIGAYAAPALLLATLFSLGLVVAWKHERVVPMVARLDAWGLPPALLDWQKNLEALSLNKEVNRTDWIADNIRRLDLRGTQVSEISKLPRRLKMLDITDLPVSSLRGLPDSLQSLRLGTNERLTNIKGLPPELFSLSFGATKKVELADLPRDLRRLEIEGSNLGSLEGLPDRRLNALTLNGTAVKRLKNLPGTIRELRLKSNPKLQIDFLPGRLTILELELPKDRSEATPIRDLALLPRSIEYLSLSRHPITSFKGAPALRSLTINVETSAGAIEDWTGLPPTLKALSLTGPTGIPTTSLESLETLSIDSNTLEFAIGKSTVGEPDATRVLQSLLERAPQLTRLQLSFFRLDTLAPLPNALRALAIDSGGASGAPGHRQRLRLPKLLEHFQLKDDQDLTVLTKLPESLLTLDIQRCKNLKRIESFPPHLRCLNLHDAGELSVLPKLPESLKALDITGTNLALTRFPPHLELLAVSPDKLKTLRRIPPTVRELYLTPQSDLCDREEEQQHPR
jgi:hypothetical protein